MPNGVEHSYITVRSLITAVKGLLLLLHSLKSKKCWHLFFGQFYTLLLHLETQFCQF